MKHLFVVALLGLLAACSNSDQQAGAGKNKLSDSLRTAAMQDKSAYTSIQWLDSPRLDLGKISRGGVVEVSWRFRNSGTQPLIIADVSAGCGCTVAERPEQPIAPGKDGVIKAQFDSKGQHLGLNEKTVTVTANTKETPNHVLLFSVNLTEK